MTVIDGSIIGFFVVVATVVFYLESREGGG